MNRVYGSKYKAELDVAEIAKLVRADIKTAIAAGELPEGLKCGVRISRYSMGQSIDLSFAVEGPWTLYNPARLAFERDSPHSPLCDAPDEARWIYSTETRALTDKLEALLDAYNHDGSDPASDYYDNLFHAHVTPAGKWSLQKREEEEAALARKAAPDTAQELQVAFLEHLGMTA